MSNGRKFGGMPPANEADFGPVDLELAVGTFHALAEEMGTSLVRSARSANIKERRDSSAALLDREANLVVQAEHIPVHLGALPASVAAIGERAQAEGDIWVLNDPYRGGTHLPDITMAAPWFSRGEVVGFVANRAHHADVGGAYPGSMPATSTSLFAEGLVIPPVRLEAAGVRQEDVLDLILANTRRPAERRADLMAQAAAVRLGLSRLSGLEQERGGSYVQRAFAEVRAYSLKRAAASLRKLPEGTYRGCDRLEVDGLEHEQAPIPVPVEVRISAEELVFDFRESPDAIAGNLNCSRAVTVSACLFFARSLLDPSPFGAAGCQSLVRVLTRAGSLLDAQTPHAVAGGNVETSQRVVDAILDALGEPLGLPAASQGTMNNLALGGPSYTYYETLAGGGGASSAARGTDAIHSGMTNTLNTPIEALERDFPLRVERYEIREGSGGAGQQTGGDGLVRRFRVLEASSLSLLTERRWFAPPGRSGGEPGAVGRCLVNDRQVPAKGEHRLDPGDTFTLETPGGGGWGEPRPGKET